MTFSAQVNNIEHDVSSDSEDDSDTRDPIVSDIRRTEAPCEIHLCIVANRNCFKTHHEL